MTNKAFSKYNGLLVTLHRKMSQGLQFDVNYTWSHSLDNISRGQSGFWLERGGGILCDAIHIRVCYGNSDFDVNQAINGDYLYSLPWGGERASAATYRSGRMK